MFGGRKQRDALAALQQENHQLRDELQRVGALDVMHMQRELEAVTRQVQEQRQQFETDRNAFAAHYAQQRQQLE